MTTNEFERQFRAEIRVQFNWPRFRAENWPVEKVKVTPDSDLSRCFLPWYPKGKKLSLASVTDWLALLPKQVQNDILAAEAKFKASLLSTAFAVPTYRLPGDDFLILDRCHRLSGLSLAGLPFDLTLCNVKGPHDKDCLTDLGKWR